MAAAQPPPVLKHNPIILGTTDLGKCLTVMQDIVVQGMPVAIDAEGINLSAKGRMTLLQICTWDGHVYLLDLIDPDFPDDPAFGKKLLVDGGVKTVLESGLVKTVVHACSSDSAALYHQFGIQLDKSQVFDTQSADKALQSLDGAVFPKSRKLSHLAEIYGTPQHPLKEDHAGWMLEDKEAWGKRPLSREMIDYASYDVATLIPELYDTLKRQIEMKGGQAQLRQHIDWDVNFHQDRKFIEREKSLSARKGVEKLYRQIHRNHTPRTDRDELTDDERISLQLLNQNRKEWGRYVNPTVAAIEEAFQLEFIYDLEEEVRGNPPDYEVGGGRSKRLYCIGKHPSRHVREASKALRREIKDNKKKSGAGNHKEEVVEEGEGYEC